MVLQLPAAPGAKAAPITPGIAIDTSHVPGSLLADPGERLIIATARRPGMPIATANSNILAYAEADFLHAIPC